MALGPHARNMDKHIKVVATNSRVERVGKRLGVDK